MVQEQIVIQKRENDDLMKRNQHLYDQYTRIDIECNRVSEELVSSSALLEKLRNECANLRAEKKIWELADSDEVKGKGIDITTSKSFSALKDSSELKLISV